jgi:hypothetical protein
MVPELKKNARVAERKETFLKNYLIDLQKFLEIFFPILKFGQVKEKMYLTWPLISSHGAQKPKNYKF